MNDPEIKEKILIAKMNDKLNQARYSNKITYTDFLTTYKQAILEKELKRIKEKNFYFYGGYPEAEYKILILYPDKFIDEFENFKNGIKKEYKTSIVERMINDIIKIIRIKLPKENIGVYEHRNYLSAVMKFGLVRERMGDIISSDDGADIIVLKENTKYLKNSLQELTRFKKADIEVLDINEIREKKLKFKQFKITINSNRLDNFISEILKISRSRSEEIIKDKRVFVNTKLETKLSKEIYEKDIIVIRGNGKYRIKDFVGYNKKEKMIYEIDGY
jgi:RNA-binding protein YlmH